MREAEWFEVSGAVDNAAATATRALEGKARHVITSIMASFSSTKTKDLTITVGGKSLVFTVYDKQILEFDAGLRGSPGAAVSASLAASGTGGVTGSVIMSGYTIG